MGVEEEEEEMESKILEPKRGVLQIDLLKHDSKQQLRGYIDFL